MDLADSIDGMALKDRIREVMESTNMTKSQFARAMGVSRGAVSQWLEGDIKGLRASTASKMEKLSGFSYKWIVTGRGAKMASGPTGLEEMEQISSKHAEKEGGHFSSEAHKLATLFDMLPNDTILRAQAYFMCTEPLLKLLRPTSTATPAQSPADLVKTAS